MRASLLALILASGLAAQTLPGSKPLDRTGDLGLEMVASIDSYLNRQLRDSVTRRPKPSPESRNRLKLMLGMVDARVPFDSPQMLATVARDAKVGEGAGYDIYAIRWPALDGIDGEGLLLKPKVSPSAYVVAIPDADDSPEALAGLVPGVAADRQFARKLAESGAMVVVPYILDRADDLSGNPSIRFTNQPHREFIHRMSYEMGRHIIGYEAQKVLAVVDWFQKLEKRLVGVYGYGEGGLLALFSSALDTRIGATVVSGYFQPREDVIFSEPLYRTVWSQLLEFGDAELAGLIAPRALVIETAAHPKVTGPPPERGTRRGAAPGRIETPSQAAVEREAARARRYHPKVEVSANGLTPFLAALNLKPSAGGPVKPVAGAENPYRRRERQFQQMVEHTQRLMRLSEFRRKEYFAQLDGTSVDALRATSVAYRKAFSEDVIGQMPPATEPLSAFTRKIYDTPKYTGYDVVIPVWGEVYASGILLLPKDLKPGEKRPVVVCQHGLEGRPADVVQAKDERTRNIYADFAAALADRGFIVFAPQNPYLGGDKFRVLQRKANPLKLSLFSFIIGQHARIIDWLETQPWTDKSRIAFYGLSYGGKTAVRVPAVETRYVLSICSGDFNEWIWKNAAVDFPFSYMFTGEYEMMEFNLGHTFNYAEMAMLIAPRPFMVERGHRDGVGIDEWVSSEFAKVRRFYTYLGLKDKTEIEYFPGPHQIHGVGTYDFLRRHLNWPKQ